MSDEISSLGVIDEVYSFAGLGVDSLDDEGVDRIVRAAGPHREKKIFIIKLSIHGTVTEHLRVAGIATISSGLVALNVLNEAINVTDAKAGGGDGRLTVEIGVNGLPGVHGVPP